MNTKSTNPKLFKSCEQFVMSLYKAFDSQPQKLQSFITLFYRNKRSSNQALVAQMKLVELIQDVPDLVDQLNRLVPEDFRVPRLDSQGNETQEVNSNMTEMEKAIVDLKSRNLEKAEDLTNIITEIQENGTAKNLEAFKEKLRLLLQEEEPYLYNLVVKYFQFIWEENMLDKEENPEPVGESSNALSKMEQETDENKPKALGTGKPADVGKKPKPPIPSQKPMPPVNPSEKLDASLLPPMIRNELLLFDYLQGNLRREEYDQLMKIIYLYTECVIGASEVLTLTRDLFEENENYFSFFCDIISAREITRRKNTTIFKPLNETDFKKMNCERSLSYTKVPDFFPYMKSPIHPKNPKAYKYLNQTWISVPQGSEVNFKIKAKNSYEENLFKCEDERYEFDRFLYNCTQAINWLNELDNQESEEKLNNLVERIIQLKVIQKFYSNNMDIVEMFRKTPTNLAKVLADRIQAKAKDVRDTKFNQARKNWHEMSQENFHRSLDHRSFYFKQYEKKFTHQKSFTAEALSRYNDLNMLRNLENLGKYWSILNTFDGISNGVACRYSEEDRNRPLEKRSPFPMKNLPIFRLCFSNKKISQDIFDMLCLKVQNFHANLTEKDKISRYLKVFMLELMQFPYELGRTYDLVFELKTFLDIVSRIEAKIYDKSFNFNTARMDETEKASREETIYSAVDRQRQGSKDVSKKKDTEENGYYRDTLSYVASNHHGSNAYNKKMEEELAAKKNPTESLDDELRLDSSSEDQTNIREMEYATENHPGPTSDFLPQVKKGQIMFYGTQYIYHLVRLYFALYERFLKAYEISQEYEQNSKTALLSEEEKKKLAAERYETFKWILAHLIRSNFDNEKYEDLLRSIFGNKAYLMSYIDKIIHLITVTIQKLLTDDISLKSLNLYPERDLLGKTIETNPKVSSNKPKDWLENVYLGQLNHLTLKNMNCLQTTSFYRFLHDPQSQNLTINMYNSPFKDWVDKLLDATTAYSIYYLNSFSNRSGLKNSLNNVYLRRAKEKNRKKTVRVLLKIEQKNSIEWKHVPNTVKLVTESFHQEDFVIILKRKMNPAKELLKKACSQFTKVARFKEWHSNILQSMSTKTS